MISIHIATIFQQSSLHLQSPNQITQLSKRSLKTLISLLNCCCCVVQVELRLCLQTMNCLQHSVQLLMLKITKSNKVSCIKFYSLFIIIKRKHTYIIQNKQIISFFHLLWHVKATFWFCHNFQIFIILLKTNSLIKQWITIEFTIRYSTVAGFHCIMFDIIWWYHV